MNRMHAKMTILQKGVHKKGMQQKSVHQKGVHQNDMEQKGVLKKEERHKGVLKKEERQKGEFLNDFSFIRHAIYLIPLSKSSFPGCLSPNAFL